MENFVYLFLLSIPTIIVLDYLWYCVAARAVYIESLGQLRGELRWGAGAVLYILFAFGLTFFATHSAFVSQFIWKAALFGGIFGLVVHAAWGLANRAVLKEWSVVVTSIDMLWGTVRTALAAIAIVTVLLELTK